MAIETKKLTYEDYLKLPHTMQRYEIIDGVMIMSPAPSVRHQLLVKKLTRLLDAFVEGRKLGFVLPSPLDVEIQRDPLRTRQPDLFFLSLERLGSKGIEDLLGMQTIVFAPDLVIEILSPSDSRSEIQGKLSDYQRIGVRECWLVSPEAETVEVLRLLPEKKERIGLFGRGETVRSEVLHDLNLSVDAIFA